jgi:N4-gp56 family major capsid protein
MADLTNVTTLVNGDVFDPEVVSDMINAKVSKKAVMSGYIKVDSTLNGVPGSTITVPRWGYIGEAVDLEEGQPIDTTKMAFTTAQYGIKKIGKGVMLTDEAQLSGYGNPMGTATNQIAMSISEKLDNDRVAVLYESKNEVDQSTSIIKYTAIVDGVDMFGEEEDSRKVILIHSKQKTQLRKDPDFISADKFQSGVMVSGAIGRVAGCDVVVSNKVKLVDGIFYNPIIKLDNDAETEDDIPAVTYFLKRGNLVEHKREEGVGDKIICTAFGMPALTNEAKVVILKTKEK